MKLKKTFLSIFSVFVKNADKNSLFKKIYKCLTKPKFFEKNEFFEYFFKKMQIFFEKTQK